MRIPGATNFGFSFALFRLIIVEGFVERAFNALGKGMSKRRLTAAKSRGVRIENSPEAPLEKITGTENLSASATSLRKLDNKRTRSKLDAEMIENKSTSNEANAFAASSASAASKNRFLTSIEGKDMRSTRLSFAACLATTLDKHTTDITSNFRRKRLSNESSSFALFGTKSARVTKSMPTESQRCCSLEIVSLEVCAGNGTPTPE